MSYCINPQCKTPENCDRAQNCHSCGTALLIADRYRIIHPVRSPNPALPTEIYAVADWGTEENQWGTLKVLKVLKYTHHPTLIRLFKQEARTLIWLAGSTGIPQVEPDGYFTIQLPHQSQKLSCLVMEKIEGETLAQFLNKHHHISPTLALDWLTQLTHILHKIHQYNLVHRDIKPSNLMLQPDGKLRLIDFGAVGEAGIDTTPIGSPGYSAPEQIIGKAEVRSDFFALGRTFVHLLTGTPPIDFSTDETTGKINWRNPGDQLEGLLPYFLDELMEPLPEKRPKNTQVILEKLKTISL